MFLAAAGPCESARRVYRPTRKVTVPALHPETGDIVVRLDGDEVTVRIGGHFHCHFETYLDEGVPQARGEELAATRAVEFIEVFMADSIVVRVRREGGRVVSAGTHSVDTQEASPDVNESDYLWSGPSRTSS